MKNFLIIALVITAVYQTGMLWLEDNASHNFFYSLFSAFGSSGPNNSANVDIIDPQKTIIGYGNRKYSLFYSEEENEVMAKGNAVLSEIIVRGRYLGVQEEKWDSLLGSRCLIYDYPFSVSAAEYVKGYRQKGKEITENVTNFNRVVITPNRTDSETLYAYFVDEDKKEVYQYAIEGSASGSALYGAIEQYQQNPANDLIYVSTKQNDFKLFKGNVFVPQWTEAYFYPRAEAVNPFKREGKLDHSLLEDGVDGFFNNYASKQNSNDNGVYTFSDEVTVVKYYPNGILEYYNYDSYDDSAEQSLSSAYYACKAFFAKDTSLKGSYVLSGVEINAEGLVFYFDYTVSGFPVEFTQAQKDSYGMKHAIEVVVKNNAVKKYKRYVTSFYVDTARKEFTDGDFITAIDQAVTAFPSVEGEAVTQVDDIALTYLYSGEGEMNLRWFVTIDNVVYISNSKAAEVREDELGQG